MAFCEAVLWLAARPCHLLVSPTRGVPMKFVPVLFASAVGLAALSQAARAQSTATGKPPDVRTTLTAALSPPLSASQLAKQAMIVPTTAPIGNAGPAAGIKAAPVSTSLPPDPKLADVLARASAAKLRMTPQQLVTRDLAIAQGRMPAPLMSGSARTKPADLSTELPADPSTAGANATALANKLAHAHTAAASRPGTKPAPVTTNGQAPTTLSPEQVSKRAQGVASSQRKPQ
jgi:hypothetical protein